jgi:hypothetical protein
MLAAVGGLERREPHAPASGIQLARRRLFDRRDDAGLFNAEGFVLEALRPLARVHGAAFARRELGVAEFMAEQQ